MLEDRLDKLNRRIFEYYFAPGPRDTAKLNEMRDTAKRMARQLDRMDKRLLGLEATKPMKDLSEQNIYPKFTTFTGDPLRYSLIFSSTIFRSRCRLSTGAQAIWGVRMQFGAFNNGFSGKIGSDATTSAA